MTIASAPPHTRPAVRPVNRIERHALLARLEASDPCRAIVLHGPAGCGKTSLLDAWRSRLALAGTSVAWISRPPAGDVDTFIGALAAALQASVAAGTTLPLRERRDDVHREAEHRLLALLADLADGAPTRMLMLDFGPDEPAAEVVQTLQAMLDDAPPNLQTVIATRRPLRLALSRLRARGELLELRFDDLRFSADELRQYLGTVGEAAAQARIPALLAATDGWPVALRWLNDARSPDGMDIAKARHLQALFEAEVLGPLPAPEAALLGAIAIATRACPALAVELMAGAVPLHEAIVLMDRLQEADLVRPVDGASAEWRQVSPLLRAAILRRLTTDAQEELFRLHSAALRWFERDGNPVGAVHHAVACGQIDRAEEVAHRWLPLLFAEGRIWDLVRICRELPASTCAKPSLRPWWAWHQLLERDYNGCRESVAVLDGQVQTPDERYRLTLLRSLCAMLCDDKQEALRHLVALESPPASAEAFALAGRRNVLTWVYLAQGAHERARQTQFDGLTLIHGRPLQGTPFGTLAGHLLVGLSHAVEGRASMAERIYREVLYQAERRGPATIDQAITAAALLASVLYELNDVAEAEQLLERHQDLLDRVSMPDTVLRVMLTLARTRWLAGHQAGAFQALDRLVGHAAQRGLTRLVAYGRLEQLRLHQLSGEQEAVFACRDALLALEPEDGTDIGPWNLDLVLVARQARMQVARHEGRWRDALRQCETLIDLCMHHGRQRRAAGLAVQAAALERHNGQASRAMERLRFAVRLGRSLGLVRTLLDADPAAGPMLKEAVDSPAFDAVDARDARRLSAAADASPQATAGAVPPAAAGPDDTPGDPANGLNAREREVTTLLAQACSNKQIAKVLGLSPETVKWHLRNIYLKLGVGSRAEVVDRLAQATSVYPQRRAGGGAGRPR